MKPLLQIVWLVGIGVLSAPAIAGEVPAEIAAVGETLVATVHAEGAQLYECKEETPGKLVWQFREPIATLIINGKTVGRHFAGAKWMLDDGSSVGGKVAGRAPGATPNDIPWLKLDATPQGGIGLLAGAATIQRLNTKGGMMQGSCEIAGDLRSAPYAADYLFYTKAR